MINRLTAIKIIFYCDRIRSNQNRSKSSMIYHDHFDIETSIDHASMWSRSTACNVTKQRITCRYCCLHITNGRLSISKLDLFDQVSMEKSEG